MLILYSYIQERFQSRGITPVYRVVQAAGASHAPTFSFQVFIQPSPSWYSFFIHPNFFLRVFIIYSSNLHLLGTHHLFIQPSPFSFSSHFLLHRILSSFIRSTFSFHVFILYSFNLLLSGIHPSFVKPSPFRYSSLIHPTFFLVNLLQLQSKLVFRLSLES